MTTQRSTPHPSRHVHGRTTPGGASPGRVREGDGWLQVGALVAVAVPVLLLAVQPLLHDGPFSSSSDVAVMEIAVQRAAELDQTLGPYSRFQWNHPGPVLFYLLAVPYWLLGGRAEALVVGAVAINAAASIWLVALVARRCGGHAAAGAAAAVTGFHLALSAALLADPWTPFLLAVPAALFIASCADAALGHRWSLVAAVAVGTYLVQTHVGMTVVVVSVLAACVAARAGLWRHRSGSWRPPRREVRALTAALATGLLLWVPPLWQEARARPGNLSALARFFVEGGGAGHGAAEAAGALGSGMLVVPARRHLSVEGIPLDDTAALVVVLVGLVVVTAVGARRRQWFAVALGAVSLTGALTAFTSLLRVQGQIYGYLVLWAGAIPLGGALAGVVLLTAGARSTRGDRQAVGTIALVLLTLTTTVLATREALAVEAGGGAADVREATTAVSSLLGASDDEVLVCISSLPAWPITAGVVADLRRDGIDVRLQRSWLFMFGDHLAPTGSEQVMIEFDLVQAPPRELPLGPPTVIATTSAVKARLYRLPPAEARPDPICQPTR